MQNNDFPSNTFDIDFKEVAEEALKVTPPTPAVEPVAAPITETTSMAFAGEEEDNKLHSILGLSDPYAEDKNEPVVATKQEPTKVVNFSLSNFEFDESSDMDVMSLQSLIDTSIKTTEAGYGVVLMKSSYYAEMKALDISTRSNFVSSNVPPFEYFNKLYGVVYSRIVKMSIPIPKYNVWLKMTSYADLDTLYFGLFAKTWNKDVEFDITCGKCETKLKANANPSTIIQAKDDEVFSRIQEVIKNVETVDDIKKDSLLFKSRRVKLNTSNYVVDIRLPSLADHLQIVRKYSGDKTDTTAASTLLYIRNFYIPNEKSGKYVRISDEDQILYLLRTLSIPDLEDLEKEVESFTTKYEIDYKIPKFNCTNCNNSIGPMALDMEQLVFMKVGQKI